MQKFLVILFTAFALTFTTDSFAGKGSSRPSSNSGRSFSSGSSKPSSSSPKPSSAGKTFSSGSSKPSTAGGKTFSSGGKTSSSNSSKPTKSTFDSIAHKEQNKVESRQAYQKGQAAKTEYKTPKGDTVKIDPKDQQIQSLRGQLDHERWVNRDSRQHQFYGSYYSRPMVVYHDPYPSFFWWWMLDRSLDQRAMWAYHHRNDMDQARYQAMLAKDAQLEAKIKALEAKNIARDKTYTPEGMDQDLMYSDEYVNAVYNPQEQEIEENVSQTNSSWLGIIIVVIWLTIIGGVAYFIFFYKGWK